MKLKLPQNKPFFLLCIIILIHFISFSSNYYITKRNFQTLKDTGYFGGHGKIRVNNPNDQITYPSNYYDSFGPPQGFKHKIVRRHTVLPSPLRSWCSLVPKTSSRYKPMQCKISGDFPISENECIVYHHCWKQLLSTKRCCPPGRHFDHVKRKCRSIKKANCSSTISSDNHTITPKENYFYVNKAYSIPTWPPFFPGPFWYPSFPNGYMPQPALFGYAPIPMFMPMYVGAPFYPPINPYQTQGYPTGQMVAFPPGMPGVSQFNPPNQPQIDQSTRDSVAVPSSPSMSHVQIKVDLPGNLASRVEVDQSTNENEDGEGEVELRPNLMKGIDLFPTFHESNLAK